MPSQYNQQQRLSPVMVRLHSPYDAVLVPFGSRGADDPSACRGVPKTGPDAPGRERAGSRRHSSPSDIPTGAMAAQLVMAHAPEDRAREVPSCSSVGALTGHPSPIRTVRTLAG